MNDLIMTNYGYYITLFATFSFLGWAMECLVIKREMGYFENRGFATGPFCTIYGFGIMILYPVMEAFGDNLLALFFLGAIIATTFEYLVGIGMTKVFGKLWWDYSHKPFNYKGILCLESTIGWGIGTIVVTKILFPYLSASITSLPAAYTTFIGIIFPVIYAADIGLSIYSLRKAGVDDEEFDIA
ncbi:MAG: putative ABC transporter permease [Anaerovoracaceae bacterium]